MSVNSKMTALMDAIRSKAGISGLLSLDTAKTAVDSIETGITPTGSIEITENGTYDVTDKASAVVNVQGGGGTPELPDGYTRLEYIESSGTQYIDTEIVPEDGMQVEVCAVVTGSSYQNIAGCGSIILLQANNSTLANVYFGTTLHTQPLGINFINDNDYLAIFEQTGVSVRGYARTRKTKTWTYEKLASTVNSIFLFAANSNGSPSRLTTMQCYALNILVDGEAVCRLVPAIRDSDSVIGMYDIVRNIFLTNAGTGTFTGGEL